MSTSFEINALARDVIGKGASRRLRREQDLVPGIIYGAKKEPVMISVAHKDLVKSLESEAFFSHILTININGKKEQALLKDLQRHSYKRRILHIDFQRITGKEKLQRMVPLHFINEDIAVGVKKGGGVVSHHMKEIEVSCTPKNLPEFIEVDIADLDIDQILHLSDLKLPKGIDIVALQYGEDHDLPVVAVHKPKGMITETAEAEGEAEGEEEAS